MKFSEQWLREWVNPSITTQELAEQLTMSGLEVESITPVAGKFDNVVIGYVQAATQHPDAERLRVCQVDVGQAEPLSIVCGGINVRANLKVPVALVGASLPNDLKIKAAKLRGVISQGMICSSNELELGEGLPGNILELPEDAPVGKDFREWLNLNDYAIDVHVTPNRGDCLSIAGIAREVAVLNHQDLVTPTWKNAAVNLTDTLPIQVLDPKDCPRYCGRIIRGINPQAKTPVWMIERLRRSGLRNIHPVVDVTNYVMLELGQPLHAFDLTKLTEGVVIRLAKNNEKLVLLDGREIQLNSESLVIADQKSPLALAGIMGGQASAVNDATTDIFLESAYFDPIMIAGRARSYGLDTDSAYRFERGVDPNLAAKTIERATQMLLEIVGGQIGPVSEVTNAGHLPSPPTIVLRADRLEKVLGSKVPEKNIEIILQRLGMKVEKQNNAWQVVPPSYRFDLTLEEDLIEEVIRIYGYHQLPAKLPQAEIQANAFSQQQLSLDRIREFLVDRDYQEAITYSFVAPKLQQLMASDQAALTISNPISADLSVMRTSLWPGLLSAVSYNQNRQQTRIRLFESGLRFIVNDNAIKQDAVLAAAVTGTIGGEQWGIATRPVDFFDIKNDLETLFSLVNPTETLSFKKADLATLHPGQASEIWLQNRRIGYLGALHPAILHELDLTGPIYLFEIELSVFLQQPTAQFQAISKFPAIRRDISFLVQQTIAVQQILDLVRATAGPLLYDLRLFDVYQGKGVADDLRSLALGLLWQHPTRTLVDTEINQQMDQVIAALKEKFNITLRE